MPAEAPFAIHPDGLLVRRRLGRRPPMQLTPGTDPLDLDRKVWHQRTEALVDHVAQIVSSMP
jgi:hypothetical protein